jgi:hypothetical protein
VDFGRGRSDGPAEFGNVGGALGGLGGRRFEFAKGDPGKESDAAETLANSVVEDLSQPILLTVDGFDGSTILPPAPGRLGSQRGFAGRLGGG